MRPIAERHGLTPLQLACAWNLAHPAVECVAPDADPGAGADAKPIERKRAELAARARRARRSTDEEVAAIRAIGDNTRLDAAQGRDARPRGRGAPGPLGAGRRSTPRSAERWGIDPERDLRKTRAV